MGKPHPRETLLLYHIFRLKDKGFPYINRRGRGDQIVRVTIEVPQKLSGKQRDILKQFEEATSDGNYQKRRKFFDKIKDIFD